MKPVHFLFKATIFLTIYGLVSSGIASQPGDSLLDHDVRRLGSDDVVNLQEAYGGKVVLVVNTASRCAFTDQYAGLEALYADYRDKGLVVLGFPSNDFGNQEPGNEAQIKDFCRLTYGVKFPMFAKTRVQEGAADPFFTALGETAGRYPQWNFHKFLIGRDGRLVENYLSITPPQSSTLIRDIEAQL
jgi:glutathione peroxidase